MKLYDDYSRQILIKEDFKKILQVVISYLWRRAICEILTNSLSKTFATLYQAVDKDDYVNSVIKAFVLNQVISDFHLIMKFEKNCKRRIYIIFACVNIY